MPEELPFQRIEQEVWHLDASVRAQRRRTLLAPPPYEEIVKATLNKTEISPIQ